MASYHLSVKTVKRSAGRSATAAAAYRHAERIECQREGRVHDYRAKSGVEHSFIVVGEGAPAWAQDRQALWNAAEAREGRKDSVVAREWELALPSELDGEGRRALAHGFARELVGRYGVAADVAIHAPHREGDQRNWHAHVLTTTRALTQDGLTDKTKVLDAKSTGGPEIAHMRERWAVLQNDALERHGHEVRVDHRTLAVQREEARALGHEARADNLDRAPEVKLGPVVSGIERREERAAEREERAYVPVTERGTQVHEARAARSLLAELTRLREALREQVREQVRQRVEAARETYAHAREDGTNQVRAGLAALRAAAQRQGIGQGQERGHAYGPAPGDERGHDARQEREASRNSIKERLGRILAREAPHHAQDGPAAGLPAHGEKQRDRQGHEHGREAHQVFGADAIKERLDALRARERPGQRDGHQEPGHGLDPINARLRALLARERPQHDQAHERDGERHGQRHRERGHEDDGHGWGL